MAEVTRGQTETSLRFAHLALHHPQLLAQVAVDFEQLLYFGLRCSEGALHLHELLHCDRSVREVGRLGALRVIDTRTSGEGVFQRLVYTETDFFESALFRKPSRKKPNCLHEAVLKKIPVYAGND